MRTACLAGTVLGLWLAAAPLRAGVYFPTMRPALPQADPRSVNLQLADLRGSLDGRQVAGGEPLPLRKQLEEMVARLEPRLARDDLSDLERIDLGACYVRLGRYEKARQVLRKAVEAMKPD